MGLDRETRQPALRVELFVRDVPVSAAFYVEVLGFEILRDDPSGYLCLGRPGAVIALNRADHLPDGYPVKALANEPVGRGVEVVVEVSDIEAAYEHALASGRPVASPLRAQSWGLTDFRVLDPDGYYIRLTGLSEPQ